MQSSRSFADRNGNGIPDSLEKKRSLGDLNGNGIPDVLERKSGSSWNNDMNRNGIPDNLERGQWSNDRNGNGIPDNLERRSFNDLNGNGIPDALEGGRTFTSTSTYTSGLQGGVARGLSTTNVVQVQLPVQVRENIAVVHEEIRQERVEEIQPVVNIEKIKTEVHQVTQPLLDKEVKAVSLEQRVLPAQVLPEIVTPGGVAAARDVSTVNYLQTQQIVVEKPALYQEVDKLQIVEEIQPVIYKETIVPTLIKETKPVFQKIVEGAVYTQQTLPVQTLQGSHFSYPQGYASAATYQTTTYTTGLSSGLDLNRNGIPDNLERRNLNDLNGNGIPDSLERRFNSGLDLNRNGIPDNLERRSFSNDLNGNGIPDSMERRQGGLLADRNGNGIPDVLERNRGASLGDRNGNGIPDALEQKGLNKVFEKTTTTTTSTRAPGTQFAL